MDLFVIIFSDGILFTIYSVASATQVSAPVPTRSSAALAFGDLDLDIPKAISSTLARDASLATFYPPV